MHFIGCERAREVSATRGRGSAANPMATALIFKSRTGAPAKPTEQDDMDAAELKKATDAAQVSALTKMLGMSDVAKAHFGALPDDAARATFLEKSVADMNAEAEAAKTAADVAKAGKTDPAASQNPQIAELTKSVGDLSTMVADLSKQLKEAGSTDVIRRRAETEFVGHPRGVDYVVETLKAVSSLDEGVRKNIEGALKNQIDLAKYSRESFAETDVEKAAPASAELRKQAKELAKTRDIPEDDAWVLVTEMSKNADLVRRADAEPQHLVN